MIDLQGKSPKLLVIGDLMIDHYLWGSCERISPEAPVQVVSVKSESAVLGGAGNVINNLCALGAKVDVISVVGGCEISDELKKLFAAEGINVSTPKGSGSLVSFQQRGLKELVRASLHYYNTEEEIDYFITTLQGILQR